MSSSSIPSHKSRSYLVTFNLFKINEKLYQTFEMENELFKQKK